MNTKTAEQAKELIEAIEAINLCLDPNSNYSSAAFGNLYYQLKGENKKLLNDHIVQLKDTLTKKLEAL